ncbi:MAG: DeoR/GlpR transcriptional regulator [Lachnospiraceae bacterium]|nr:DeoR/GlpR transcriptional regulator [Lachnospiraceae bacterium]
MFYSERKQKILEYITKKPQITVAELSEVFGVSAVTIRKDLNELSKRGDIKRTYGGAVSTGLVQKEEGEDEKEFVNMERKREIAEKAIRFVEEGNSLIIDAGSTTQELARLIVERKIYGLTIITNAFNIADVFRENSEYEVVFTGGQYRKKILSCVGPYTINILNSINADKCFMGSNGVSLARGVTTPNVLEAEVKRNMMQNSREQYLLADSSKFGRILLFKVADMNEIDCLITDSQADEEIIAKIRNLGVTVY